MKPQIFNLGNPIRRQIALRSDGVWFMRWKREDRPGFGAWKITQIAERPIHAWYNGQHARLPK